jgi:hypothetical protein
MNFYFLIINKNCYFYQQQVLDNKVKKDSEPHRNK